MVSVVLDNLAAGVILEELLMSYPGLKREAVQAAIVYAADITGERFLDMPEISTLAFEPRARKVTFDADNMWVELTDGRQLGVPLAYFPRLLNATRKEREGFIISGGGIGIHWDDLDEDISVRALLFGVGDRTRPAKQAS